MHHCLEIPEVVHLVFSKLTPVGAGAKDLAALARTCTTFHDIALDALWWYQYTIVNLIRCMPADLWDTVLVHGTDATLRLSRPIVASDWTRLLHYSHRIKNLTCGDHPMYPNLSEVFERLRLGVPGDDLLPNLETLTWDHYGGIHPSHIHLFLGPRIRAIHLGYCDPDTEEAVLPILARRVPTLRSVVINILQLEIGENRHPHVSAFLQALSRVRSIMVSNGTLDAAALLHLGQLTTLEKLNIILPDSMSFPGINDGTLFSNLQAVALHIGSVELLTTFMQTWAKPPITSIELSSTAYPAPEAFEEIYTLLAARCAHESLRSLTLQVFEAPPNATDLSIHSGTSFQHLFCFANLVSLSITALIKLDLDDEMITDMARAWPQLEKLEISTYPFHRPRSTLLGLHALAQHCPRLRKLEMLFNASIVPPPPTPSDCRLVVLEVSRSPIADALPVARFISAIFPHVREVTTDLDGYAAADDDGGQEALGYHRLWIEVAALLPGLGDESRAE
ncbi:hypothetical protein C8R44DRAFT_957724 [Mycena epipterygia]|nr:hypothetical protein C8R44DRAFT_957724 [Mycena epipterygia]